jgi:tight adherence protein B
MAHLVGAIETRTRRRPVLADDVAPTLHDLARTMAAGSTLASAITELPDHATRPFARVVREALVRHTLGTGLGDAVAGLGAERAGPSPEAALGLTVVEVTARHGGAAAASLDRAAAAVRERRAVVAERAVHSAQARLSTLVLSALPVVFALWTALTDRRVAGFLVGSALGGACLLLGVSMNLAGWCWMRRIVRGQP